MFRQISVLVRLAAGFSAVVTGCAQGNTVATESDAALVTRADGSLDARTIDTGMGTLTGDGSLNALADGMALPSADAYRPRDVVARDVAVGRFTITSPSEAASLTAGATFTVDVSSLTGVETVEYAINGHPLLPIVTAPFSLNFDTRSYFDGDHSLVATARDAVGDVIGVADTRRFTIANSTGRVRMTSPGDGVISGEFAFTVETRKTSGNVSVDGAMLYVDGAPGRVQFHKGSAASYTSSAQIDSRRYLNGYHELTATVRTPIIDGQRVPLGIAQKRVLFDNGRVPMALIPKYSAVTATPGTTIAITVALAYTNGDIEPFASPAYDVETDSIASIAGGTLTITSPGVTRLLVTGMGLSAEVRINARAAVGIPHFAKNGDTLLTYDPARSTFVSSLFYGEPKAVERAGHIARFRDAHLNAFENGFYLSRADLGGASNTAQAIAVWDRWWNEIASSAQRQDMLLMLNGDNVARGTALLSDVLDSAYGPGLFRHALTTVKASGRVVAIEMVDESSGVWGDDVPARIRSLLEMAHGVSPRPALSWPILWLTGDRAFLNWLGDATVSDYTSNYHDLTEWSWLYPYGVSIPQARRAVDDVVLRRYAMSQRERPAITLISTCGEFYDKRVTGPTYQPGQDRLIFPGSRAENVALQIGYAALIGQAGIRGYAYDFEVWKGSRLGPVGTNGIQTGTDPLEMGTDRWAAMAAALGSVYANEDLWLSSDRPARGLGPAFVTAARIRGERRLFSALNASEATNAVRVDIADCSPNAGANIVRWHVRAGELFATVDRSEAITFRPAEWITWQCLAPGEAAPPTGRVVLPIYGQRVGTSVRVSVELTSYSPVDRIEISSGGRLLTTFTGGATSGNVDTSALGRGVWHSIVARVISGSTSTESRTMVFAQ